MPVRPVGVTVTAWCWIALGILLMGTAFLGTAVGAWLDQFLSADQRPGVGWQSSLPEVLADWWGVLLTAQFLLGFAVTFAAGRLLALHAWARRVLEWASWLGAALVVLLGIGFARFWVALAAELQDLIGEPFVGAEVIGLSVIATTSLVSLGCFVWMAGYLRLRRVRAICR